MLPSACESFEGEIFDFSFASGVVVVEGSISGSVEGWRFLLPPLPFLTGSADTGVDDEPSSPLTFCLLAGGRESAVAEDVSTREEGGLLGRLVVAGVIDCDCDGDWDWEWE